MFPAKPDATVANSIDFQARNSAFYTTSDLMPPTRPTEVITTDQLSAFVVKGSIAVALSIGMVSVF